MAEGIIDVMWNIVLASLAFGAGLLGLFFAAVAILVIIAVCADKFG